MIPRALFTLCMWPVLQWHPLEGSEFHVSQRGSDEAAGTKAAPFRSIRRARDAVRATGRRGGATVVIHHGTYFLPEPVELTTEDSGTEGAPVVYRAAKGEDVWLNGGGSLRLADFKPVTDAATRALLDPAARDRVRQRALPGDLRDRLSPEWPATWWHYRRSVTRLTELFAGARRLPMARWPNDGYTTFGDIVVAGEQEGETPTFKYKGDRPERWVSAVSKGLWLYGYWRRGYRADGSDGGS